MIAGIALVLGNGGNTWLALAAVLDAQQHVLIPGLLVSLDEEEEEEEGA